MISILGGDGKEYGPVSIEQLRRWMAEGRVTLDTRARREGESVWQRLGDLEEFNPRQEASFHAEPPSLPAALPQAQETETGLELPLAGRWIRLAASLIDGSISMMFALPGLFMIAMSVLQSGIPLNELTTAQLEESVAGVGVMMAGMLIPAVVQMVLLTIRGQTLGKLMVGIRIVRFQDEGRAGFVKAVVLRSLVPGLIGGIPYIGIPFTLVDALFIFRADRRCLHDHIADTKVVEVV